ncbi:SigB/SigF/SigG family RNA polymerase sigma factor [Pseudonocardia dioxanivorans]|uniref:RNA polymerase, sigma 28 subunit, Sig B/F/G subfamily n=1 Tax=Pseudonocardia dioxanivorans (strain ATCC 55486 / DSM 44775 / JCM 13855 / CB1190) TaxID=675635 RepID=F4CUF3_PSEUX|nr:RNA polymerase, sigma 28 subunit, Sig B/F/G subfamily [Pseudonocardia dioxanivorans CB1190]
MSDPADPAAAGDPEPAGVAAPGGPPGRAAGPGAEVPETGSSTYDHLAPLFDELAAMTADDPRRTTLRERLVTGHLPVVRHIARRFAGRGEPVDDLEQAGTVGLINAVDRFDPARGVDFLSYAVPTITGEVRRHFRDRTWSMRVPRRLKELQSSINSAVGGLAQELGRAPRPSEIADRIGRDVDEVIEGLEARQVYRSTSLDELVADSDAMLSETLGIADAELEKVDYRQTLAPLLDELPTRERTILVLRFFAGMTQTQIADEVGVSQMHVSRLLARTLARLRRRLGAG